MDSRQGRAGARALVLDRGTPIGAPLHDSPELAAAWIAWLRTMRWDFVATPTFAHAVSPEQALRALAQWLTTDSRDLYAAVGVQRGPLGDRLHVHAVVGGIGRHPLRADFLRRSWRRGNIVLDGYAPRRGFIEYLVRQAGEIEIIGAPVAYRPRR